VLDREQARSYYDRFGGKQDKQGFYEDPATRQLVAHAEFGKAKSVLELGCGTGRFAHELLTRHLPEESTYTGYDLSHTMVHLTRGRIAAFGGRARVRLSDGSPHLDAPDHSADRFVANYVLDLLPNTDIDTVLTEAHRILEPDGLLCLVTLTHSRKPLSRLLMWAWERVHHFDPKLVGGCRPLRLEEFISPGSWEIRHHEVVVAYGIPSEVLVARKVG
jgi:ubiquinone/menaquinone biosynthesis C-methylase UbiE